jgi:hypothetical protein
MASQSVEHRLPFLVFPSLSPEYLWKVVATESNRTISRHKLLENALEKAERLNVLRLALPEPQFIAHEDKSMLFLRGRCQELIARPYSADSDWCDRPAVVSDAATSQVLCVECAKESLYA